MCEKLHIYALAFFLAASGATAGVDLTEGSPSSILFFSTHLGGAAFDQGSAIAIDAEGNTVVTGRTRSADFPIVGGPEGAGFSRGQCFQGFTAFSCADVFVAKFDPDGNLIFSTVLGGTEEDWVTAVALDTQGNIVLTGWTRSADFPVLEPLPGGDALRGFQNIFVVRLEASGSRLLSSTYLGGSQADEAADLAIAEDGRILLGGLTSSDDFPGFDPGQAATRGPDALLAVLNATASEVIFAVAFGGSEIDRVNGVALQEGNRVALGGSTSSRDFPTVNPLQPRNRSGVGERALSGSDAFAATLDLDDRQWVFSTYLGGVGDDAARDVAAGPDGSLYITGETNSLNFPSLNAFQPACRMGLFGCLQDAFAAQISSDGSTLLFSTFLGGNFFDSASQIVRLDDGSLLVGGISRSHDFPRVRPILDFQLAGEGGFLARLSGDGRRLLASTHFPGPVAGLASGGDSIYFTGTGRDGVPVVNPFQPASAGAPDAFAARIAPPRRELVLGDFFQSVSASRLVVVNLEDASPANVTIEFFDRNGSPTPIRFQGSPERMRTSLSVPPGGLRVMTAELVPDLTLARAGSLRILSNRIVGAFIVNDLADPELSLPMHELLPPVPRATRFVFPIEPALEATQPNPSLTLQILTLTGLEEAQTVTVSLRDDLGNPLADCQLPLPARASFAFPLSELGFHPAPDFSSFQGTVAIEGPLQFSAAMVTLSRFGSANFPATRLSHAFPPGPTEGGFSQYIEGGGIARSSLLLINPDDLTAGEVLVEIRDPDGTPLATRLNGVDFGGSGSFPLGPAEMLALRSSSQGPLRTGSVRISSDIGVIAYLLLELEGGGVTALSLSPTTNSLLTPVQIGGGFSPGIALSGGEQDQILRFQLRDAEGRPLAHAELLLEAGRRLSVLVAGLPWDSPPDFSNFLGTLRVEADAGAVASAIWITPPSFFGFASELAAAPIWTEEGAAPGL